MIRVRPPPASEAFQTCLAAKLDFNEEERDRLAMAFSFDEE